MASNDYWNPIILLHMAECRDCSALVADTSEAKRNHEEWHAKWRLTRRDERGL